MIGGRRGIVRGSRQFLRL